MNPNTPRPGHLFFTPRTPWGTRAGQQSFRQHQRASEDARADADEKHLLWGKEHQGLGAQMATDKSQWRNGAERTLDKQGVPRSLSGQLPASPSTSPAWQVPHSNVQPCQPQPAARPPSEITKTVAAPANPATAQQMRQAGAAYWITPQEKKGLFGGHLRGSAGYGRDRPKTEPTEGTIEGGYYSNPGLQDQLEYDAAKDAPTSTSGTGAPPERSLYDGDYQEKLKKMRESQQSFGGAGRLP